MEDFITKISAFATPPLIGIVIWFLIKKFDDSEKALEKIKDRADKNNSNIDEKFHNVEQNLHSIREALHRLSNETSKVVGKIGIMYDNQNDIIEFKKELIKEAKENYGKVVYLDATVKRHEQILVSSAKVMKNQNDRISRAEADIIDIKKKKGE